MINYCTRVEIEELKETITVEDGLLFLGSCFADSIGGRMAERKFNACVNPFGTLYNPLSVAMALSRLREPTPFGEGDLFQHDGLYHSFMHHSSFSAPTAEGCLSAINSSLAYAAQHLASAKWLFISFGTAYVYRLVEDFIETVTQRYRVVTNCHKVRDIDFTREMLSVSAIIKEWEPLLASSEISQRFIFTVSPIRHFRDGAHQNSISKATLLLAIDELCRRFPYKATYFPAYELLLDELRDYRFYADDMLHPSPLAADYIFERFCEACLCNEAKEFLKYTSGLFKAFNHRVINKHSSSNKVFLTQTLSKIECLKAKYPRICFSEEEQRITDSIKELE
jgi:hypothetical protein